MITGALIGDRELVAKLRGLGEASKRDMDLTVDRLGLMLGANVQRDYLTGQVLKVQTGRLRSSIARGQPDTRSRFESTANLSVAIVGTNVSYGKTWELTGIPAHTIVPIRAKALRFEVHGQVLFRMRANIPAQGPRPYLMPALIAFKGFAMREMQASLERTAKRELKAA